MPLKNKLDARLVVKTAMVWMGLLYVICAAAFLLIPSQTLDVLWKPMFHAFNMQPSITYVIMGLIEALVYTAFATWLFVAIYNQFAKKR